MMDCGTAAQDRRSDAFLFEQRLVAAHARLNRLIEQLQGKIHPIQFVACGGLRSRCSICGLLFDKAVDMPLNHLHGAGATRTWNRKNIRLPQLQDPHDAEQRQPLLPARQFKAASGIAVGKSLDIAGKTAHRVHDAHRQLYIALQFWNLIAQKQPAFGSLQNFVLPRAQVVHQGRPDFFGRRLDLLVA